MSHDFLLGINYWPRRKAMWWWEQFDEAEVREEFAMIASIGLKVVRFFLLWESFMPTPTEVDPKKLEHLVKVADIAAELGIQVQPTFFTGHMSGPNWSPQWLWTSDPVAKGERQNLSLSRPDFPGFRIHNVYTTPWVIDAEKLLIREVCNALRGHKGVWGYSLGNEPDLFCKPPTAQVGRKWIADMIDEITEADPEPETLIGFHTASIDGDIGLRVDHAAESTSVSVMHGYALYSSMARHRLDPDYVPFVCALTAALAKRPVLFEEFGICCWDPTLGPGHGHDANMLQWDGSTRTAYIASEEEGAEYYANVLPRLQRVGALGAFAWCFPNYDPSLWHLEPCSRQEHERFFGLWRADGTLRPMGQAVADFAASKPKVLPSQKPVHLNMTPDEYYADAWNIQKRLYAEWGAF